YRKSMALPQQDAVFPEASGKGRRGSQSDPCDSDPWFRALLERQIAQKNGCRAGESRMQARMWSPGHQQVDAGGNQDYRDEAIAHSMKRACNVKINLESTAKA